MQFTSTCYPLGTKLEQSLAALTMDKEVKERLEKAMIRKPRHVKPGALERFQKNRILHKEIPSLKNLTHEDLEDIINYRNEDDFG